MEDFLKLRCFIDIFSNRMIITNYFQNSIRYSWGSSCSFCENFNKWFFKTHIDSIGIFRKDFSYITITIKIKFKNISKSISERRRKWTEFCRRSDKSKTLKREFNWLGSWTGSDDDIYRKIFHPSIENFFNLWFETMYLINKKNVAIFQIWEDTDEVGLLIYCWSRAWFYTDSHFICDDVCKCRFPKSWRTIKDNMLKWFFSDFCWRNSNKKMFFYILLANIIRDRFRTQSIFLKKRINAFFIGINKTILFAWFFLRRTYHAFLFKKYLYAYCKDLAK